MSLLTTTNCIKCDNPIRLNIGLAAGIMFEIINLQSESLGCEIQCNKCGELFFLYDSPTATSEKKETWRFC